MKIKKSVLLQKMSKAKDKTEAPADIKQEKKEMKILKNLMEKGKGKRGNR